jgi:solute carrier family 8 (sodium/calcium exchanger)
MPSIHMHWKEYQKKVVSQAKEAGSLVLAGDGRHDSMGHCAKYCAYTIFSCTTSIIIHFSLVQVNKKFCRISKHFLARYILIM